MQGVRLCLDARAALLARGGVLLCDGGKILYDLGDGVVLFHNLLCRLVEPFYNGVGHVDRLCDAVKLMLCLVEIDLAVLDEMLGHVHRVDCLL